MKKFDCDRCGTKLGVSEGKDKGANYYDVRRSSNNSRYGHKNERYICEQCLKDDPRYKVDNDASFTKKAGN